MSSRPEAGAGHLSRCLALADALGGDVVMFLDPTGPDPTFAGRLIAPHRREAAPERYDELLTALRNEVVHAVVMDSYALDGEGIRDIAKLAFTVSIDDEPGIVPGHLSIAPGLAAESTPADTEGGHVLGGGQYALLDKAFTAAPAPRRLSAGERPRVLVSFGARDSSNATDLVLSALADEATAMERVTVVLGEVAPHRADLMAKYAGGSVAFAVPSSAPEMRALYDDHDFCIGAGGVGLLERMAAGLPGIVISVAGNQCANASAAVNAGAAISGGLLRDFESNSFRALMTRTLSNAGLCTRLAARGRDLVDGRGCERAAAAVRSEYQAWRRRYVSL